MLPAAKEEGKNIKKRSASLCLLPLSDATFHRVWLLCVLGCVSSYAVFNKDGTLAELKGFELKVRPQPSRTELLTA